MDSQTLAFSLVSSQWHTHKPTIPRWIPQEGVSPSFLWTQLFLNKVLMVLTSSSNKPFASISEDCGAGAQPRPVGITEETSWFSLITPLLHPPSGCLSVHLSVCLSWFPLFLPLKHLRCLLSPSLTVLHPALRLFAAFPFRALPLVSFLDFVSFLYFEKYDIWSYLKNIVPFQIH